MFHVKHFVAKFRAIPFCLKIVSRETIYSEKGFICFCCPSARLNRAPDRFKPPLSKRRKPLQ